MRTRRIDANGLSHFIREYGPEDGPVAILLHGFPDSSELWAPIVPALVAAGYRIIAPDLRGFGETDVAEKREDYVIATGAAPDVLAIMDALGIGRAHLVGHDFGSAVAWTLAMTRPDRFITLSALSLGHPAAFLHAGASQKLKSWYAIAHQIPRVAETGWRFADFALARIIASDHPDIEKAIADLRRKKRLRAGLNWYRANLNPLRPAPPFKPGEDVVRIPTLGVCSDKDAYLGEAQMRNSFLYLASWWRYERIEGAGHWLMHDAPDRLIPMLFGHWRRHSL